MRPALFSSPEKRTFIVCLLLGLSVLAFYNSITQNAFVNFDDDRYILDNPQVRHGLTWQTVEWAFTTFSQGNWHPLTWISHATDYQLFKRNPIGTHYVNVLLHTTNVILLFLLLQKATGFSWRSAFVAAIFGLHPINVESVAWAAERKNVLSMLFLLLAMYAYDAYARRPRVKLYIAVFVLFAFGLMAKPQIITLPFVLLLWDYWPLGRMRGGQPPPAPGTMGVTSFAALLIEKIPLLLLSLASAVITMLAQSSGGAVRTVTEIPFAARLQNAVVAYGRYLEKAFWPVNLAPLYPHPGMTLPAWEIGLSSVFLLAVTVVVLWNRRNSYLVFGWFCFLGTLVPMIGLVQVGEAALADRYAYFPFIGLFIMTTWGVAEISAARRFPKMYAACISAAVVLMLGVLTYRQVGHWRTSETLWTWTLQVTDRNFIAHDNLGGAYVSVGRFEEAIPHFRSAVAIRPNDAMAHLNIGAYEQQHGNEQAAIEQYEMVPRLTTDNGLRATALANLGSAYRDLGEAVRAKTNYHAALELNPDCFQAVLGLGLLAQKSGNAEEAVRQFSRAVLISPTDMGYLLLERSYRASGRVRDAQVAHEQALRISSNIEQAEQNVEQVLKP